MKQIVIVDDDTVITRHYSIALEMQGYSVEVFHNADEVKTNKLEKCVLLILDLMMPSGARVSAENSMDGMLTGVLLLEALREEGFSAPCALLTNLNITSIFDDVSSRLAPVGNVVLMKKSEFNPIEFASVVDAVINGSMREKLSASLLSRFQSSLLLKPAFFGVGIDVKKLFGGKD